MRHRILIAVLLIVVFTAGTSFAKKNDILPKNIHMFAPTTDGSGIIGTYGTEYLGTLRFAYSFWVDDSISPLSYDNPLNTDQRITLISNQAAGIVNFSFGITDYINIGYAFPYIIARSFDEDYDSDHKLGTTSNTVEDNRIDVKILALQRTRYCLGLGLLTTITVPFYTPNNYASDDGATVAPKLVFDIGRGGPVTWAFNFGYKYYSQIPASNKVLLIDGLDIGDELLLNTGIKVRFANNQELLIDSAVRTLVSAPFGNADADYAEVYAAYRKYWVRMHYNALTLGLSMGATQGVGSPFVRLFLGFGRDEARLHYLVDKD
jgi:hypothetical protein